MTIQAKTFRERRAQHRIDGGRAESRRHAGRRTAEDTGRRGRCGRRSRAPARAAHREPGQGPAGGSRRSRARRGHRRGTRHRQIRARQSVEGDRVWRCRRCRVRVDCVGAGCAASKQNCTARHGRPPCRRLTISTHRFAAALLRKQPPDQTTLPRHPDPDPVEHQAQRDGEPTDPWFDRGYVATDDPAFMLAAVENARQGVIDARSAASGLGSAELRAAAQKIGEQNEATRESWRQLASAKGWRLPQANHSGSSVTCRHGATAWRHARQRELHPEPDLVPPEHPGSVPRATRRQG